MRGETDVLVLTDIETDEVELTRSGDDLLIKVLSTQETITGRLALPVPHVR